MERTEHLNSLGRIVEVVRTERVNDSEEIRFFYRLSGAQSVTMSRMSHLVVSRSQLRLTTLGDELL